MKYDYPYSSDLQLRHSGRPPRMTITVRELFMLVVIAATVFFFYKNYDHFESLLYGPVDEWIDRQEAWDQPRFESHRD